VTESHADTARKTPQVVSLGDTMLMFAPPRYELLEYCLEFRVLNGGSESNVAIGLERLGMRAAWIGKLPRHALGRKVVNEIRSFGVDTSAVVWTDTGRLGTFFVEWGADPRPLATIYDRANCAMGTLCEDELDWEFIQGAKWLHLTGITPALSDGCRECIPAVARRARSLGMKVSFDVNYRSLLWSTDEARQTLTTILPHVNLLVATEEDAALLLGDSCDRQKALRRLHGTYGLDAAVMTCGDRGSLGFDGESIYRSEGHKLQPVNRLGAGDAFMAGLLFAYIQDGLQTGLYYGSAMAALKMTIPQNTPMVNREDVERLLSGRKIRLIR